MNRIELLKEELQVVLSSMKTPKQIDEVVMQKVGISKSYLEKIKSGGRVKLDNEENRNLLTKVIKLYRKEYNKQV